MEDSNEGENACFRTNKEDIIRLPTLKSALGSILVFAIKVNQDG